MKYSMRTYIFLALTILVLSTSFLIFGESFPKGEFRSPIKYPISLSGTYGELRPNHFHAGIDIKSPNGQSGADIVAAADGYVSRIKVRSGGYGNAIYMNHPNGYTTVYGHLSKFGPQIARYVKKKQYQKESFSVDLHPPSDMFRFHKGDVIGFMGNTGTSSGPHLHFEIRDRRTEEPLNALRFGLPVKDDLPPKLHKLKTYFLDDQLFPFK
ncbi:MAG TPA: M23 family metallopeptidase [Saprospiraceae bacterium]|nr:M23 family metallopeptidase [Saprospiraceae bacterium]